MKGFFRGLRCMFDTDDEKEPEIQIGNPTDVKHVAHIGCDGPSTPAPSWMNEFQSGSGDTNAGSKDLGVATASPGRPKTKHSKRQTTSSSAGNDAPDIPNSKTRKNKTSSSDSAANDRSRTGRIKNSILGSESSAQEQSVKKTRKKKGEGTTRSSKTRNKDPSTKDADSGCSDGVCQKPID